LTLDLLTSGSMHAEVLPRTMSTYFGADSSSRYPVVFWSCVYSYVLRWSLNGSSCFSGVRVS